MRMFEEIDDFVSLWIGNKIELVLSMFKRFALETLHERNGPCQSQRDYFREHRGDR
jgi:hypothetical protein